MFSYNLKFIHNLIYYKDKLPHNVDLIHNLLLALKRFTSNFNPWFNIESFYINRISTIYNDIYEKVGLNNINVINKVGRIFAISCMDLHGIIY